jgi:hypothetical protein
VDCYGGRNHPETRATLSANFRDRTLARTATELPRVGLKRMIGKEK